MAKNDAPSLLEALIGQVVVIDLISTYVCLGTFAGLDREFLDIRDADLHDFRDSTKTRELYVYDSVRLGIRRNRTRVLVRRSEVVAVTCFSEVAES
jgi:hypothetical protein